ncbi:MAG: tripartite tricarboxylate transporter substrate binding protein [Oscillospiraceae bacterium]|nr:tripartite tricarboxylate transporter substrate binding protein [Oscillospiraceae bacterium]
MKKALSVMLILCVALALAACGGSAPAPAPQTAAPSEAPAPEEESAAWTPGGPVTMIVAYKAGSGTDNTARVLARYAEKYIGQSIEIENVDGGSGSDGWSRLASAEADGMTLGFLNLPNFSSSIVNGLGDYTSDDFRAICNHVTETSILVVRANDGRFPDLVSLAAYGKEHEGAADELKASTNGVQASNHIGAQAFARSAGFHYIDIPQGNTTDELKSLLGQEADFCVIKVADLAGMASELKVLGVFSPERLSEMPDVPTLGEHGYYGAWMGASRCIAAPAGVGDDVVAFYESAFKAAMEDPDYLAAAALDGITTDYMDAAAAEEIIDQQQAFAESLSDGFWFE